MTRRVIQRTPNLGMRVVLQPQGAAVAPEQAQPTLGWWAIDESGRSVWDRTACSISLTFVCHCGDSDIYLPYMHTGVDKRLGPEQPQLMLPMAAVLGIAPGTPVEWAVGLDGTWDMWAGGPRPTTFPPSTPEPMPGIEMRLGDAAVWLVAAGPVLQVCPRQPVGNISWWSVPGALWRITATVAGRRLGPLLLWVG